MSAPVLPGSAPRVDASRRAYADVSAPPIDVASRPRVALLRGAQLSSTELQTYEQLLDRFDLTAWRVTASRLASGSVALPTRDIRCLDEPFARLSGRLAALCNRLLRATCGLDQLHLGLVDKLSDTDIVHTLETHQAFSWQGLAAKRAHGCRLVTTVRENRPFAGERFAAKRRMKHEVLAGADLHLATTERARQCLLLEGADPRRVEVIPAGTDVERFHPEGGDGGLRARLGIGPDEIVLLSLAALRWEKGAHDILHALKALTLDPATRRLPLRLVLAGAGPEEPRLRALADRIDLGQRVLITRLAGTDRSSIYRAADVFVLASASRPGWLERADDVLPEALASGLALVATRSGSVDELVGDAGLLVPPSDFLGLASGLREVLLDGEQRAQLGRAARDRAVRRHDSRRVVAQIAEAYRRVLER